MCVRISCPQWAELCEIITQFQFQVFDILKLLFDLILFYFILFYFIL